MKTKCYLCIACFLLTGLFFQTANAQANTELSNLISPTKVNQSLLPITTNSKDIGSSSLSWRVIYLGGSVYMDGRRFLSNGNDSTNVFIGADAGSKPTFFNPKTGQNNTASGQYALYSYTTGFANTATGNSALFSNTSGFTNTATGNSALRSNTTGNGNTAVGSSAGAINNNNTYCTFLGYDADQSVTTDFTNSTALGNTSRITAS